MGVHPTDVNGFFYPLDIWNIPTYIREYKGHIIWIKKPLTKWYETCLKKILNMLKNNPISDVNNGHVYCQDQVSLEGIMSPNGYAGWLI